MQTVIGPVHMTGSGFKEMKRGMKSDSLKAKLIAHVPEILKAGQYDGKTAAHKPRSDGYTAFHFFQKEVDVGDAIVTAGVNVGERDSGMFEYSAYGLGYDDLPNWIKNKSSSDAPGNEPGTDEPSKSGDDTLDATVDDPADGINIVILKVVDKGAGRRISEPEDQGATEVTLTKAQQVDAV